jgi:multiple sugar transport system permease protein
VGQNTSQADAQASGGGEIESKMLIRRGRLLVPPGVRQRLCHRYGWVAPAVLTLFTLTIFPLLFLIYLSFHQWSLNIAARRNFVGLESYARVLTDGAFLDSLIVTLVFTVSSVLPEMILGTAIAMFIKGRLPDRWRSFFQSVLLLPMMMSYIAIGLLWRYMWDGSIGFINYLFQSVGLPPQGWLGDPTMAIFTVAIADIWQWTPFVILVVLSGLEGLPREPFEAAEMAGASTWQTFRYITLPLLKPVLIVVLLFRIADAFRIFDKIWIMTRGGPGNASESLSVLIYQESFQSGRFGTAAVMSIFMLVIISVIALVIIRQAQKMEAI